MQPSSEAGRPERRPAPPPQCKTILLCEQRIVEADTRNVSLINIFTSYNLASYLGRTSRAFLFAKLTGGLGNYELRVQVLDLEEDKIIAESQPMHALFPDKLGYVDITVEVPPLPIKHPGIYDLVLLANGQEVERLQFDVRPPPGTKPPQVPQGPVDEWM